MSVAPHPPAQRAPAPAQRHRAAPRCTPWTVNHHFQPPVVCGDIFRRQAPQQTINASDVGGRARQLPRAVGGRPQSAAGLGSHSPICRHQEECALRSSASIEAHCATDRPWPWHSSGKEAPHSAATASQSSKQEQGRTITVVAASDIGDGQRFDPSAGTSCPARFARRRV